MSAHHLTVSQAAQFLGCSVKTIRRHIARGAFPGAFKVNPSGSQLHWRIPAADLERFVQTHRAPPIKTGARPKRAPVDSVDLPPRVQSLLDLRSKRKAKGGRKRR